MMTVISPGVDFSEFIENVTQKNSLVKNIPVFTIPSNFSTFSGNLFAQICAFVFVRVHTRAPGWRHETGAILHGLALLATLETPTLSPITSVSRQILASTFTKQDCCPLHTNSVHSLVRMLSTQCHAVLSMSMWFVENKRGLAKDNGSSKLVVCLVWA